ncbi:MAG: M3 family metallopeptidase [Elusimicrobiota bacterium]|nr:M3 family metallopeptidase [Elusimicrobiota bacterium]
MRTPALLLAVLLCAPAAHSAAAFQPHGALDYSIAPAALLDHCKAAKKRAESSLAGLASLPATARTFDNTVWALDRALAQLNDDSASDQFLKYVSVSSSVRAAANECETLLGQFGVETYSREDLYAAVKSFAAKGEKLSGEDARLLEKALMDFRRAGLELPKEKRAEVKAIRTKLVELESTFGKNINESKDFALFTRAELLGAPDDFIERLEKVDGKYKVTLDYPDYFPFMENVQVGASRKVLEGKYNNRAARENLPILKEVLALRQKAAKLMGYPTHAAFVLEDRMAKDTKTVRAFYERLVKRLKPMAQDELKTLVALKFVFEGKASDGVIRAWDYRFYDNALKKTKYAVDAQKIKEYFPADLVTEQMFAVYQRILGLKYRPLPDAVTWHPDVKLYEIADAASGEVIGYFYADLFPREGKYKHAAAFTLIQGRALPEGGYQKPVSAMVANFNKPTADKPSLLTHDEVETFFHEFGHIMHQTLTRARHARFSGTSVARDFVEAPSQMLENWVWDAQVLGSLSGHYKDRSQKLPKELLERMLAAKDVNSGLFNLRQVLFGAVDQLYHTDPPSDTTAAYGRLMSAVSLIPMSEGTHPEASFGHLMGYDSGYYGYLWSKVYAQDLFSRFESSGGPLDPAVGKAYRKEILEPGASRDEMDSIKTFLGREPREDAFLRSIGIKSASAPRKD